MDNMIIRFATLEDKDQVVAIRKDFHDGIDYIATFYEHLLNCPNAKSYVGLINGEIMAYVVAFVIDDGQTVIIRSGRVSEKYEGCRYYTLLHMQAIKESGARENRYSRLGTNEMIPEDPLLSSAKPFNTMGIHRYLFNPKALEGAINSPCNHRRQANTIIATSADLELYLTSPAHKSYLFPDNILTVNAVPYRLLPSNVPLIGVPGHTNMLTDVDAGGQAGLLSAITVYPSNYPLYTGHMEIYGSDSQSVETHITAQLEYIKTHVVNDVVGLCVLFSPRISNIASSIESVLNCLSIMRSRWKSTANPKIEYNACVQYRFSFDMSQLEISKL